MLSLRLCAGLYFGLIVIPLSTVAQPVAEQWLKTVGDEEHLFTADSLALAGDAALVAAGSRRPAGDVLASPTPVLVVLTTDGELVREIVLDDQEMDVQFLIPGIPFLATLEEDLVIGALQKDETSAQLFSLSLQGRLAWKGFISGQPRAVIASAERLVLFVQQQRSVGVFETERNLTVLGEPVANIPDAFFVSAMATKGGTILIATNSLKSRRSPRSGLDLFTLSFSSEGADLDSIYQTEGVGGSVAPGENGGFVMLYEQPRGDQRLVELTGFDKNHKVVWTTDIVKVRAGLNHSQIVAVQKNHYVVASADGNRFRLSLIDSTGDEEWFFLDDSLPRWSIAGKDIVVDGSTVYVLTDVISSNQQRQMNNKLGIWRFEVADHTDEEKDSR